MTHLYYTNPLTAAIMAQEHGIVLENEEGLHLSARDLLTYVGSPLGKYFTRAYVHPDSYDAFKPRKGDAVTTKDGLCLWSIPDFILDMWHRDWPNGEVVDIIQRAGKPFIMPEREE